MVAGEWSGPTPESFRLCANLHEGSFLSFRSETEPSESQLATVCVWPLWAMDATLTSYTVCLMTPG